MAGKDDFDKLEVERTTRWVEHEQLQKNLIRWKIAFIAVPIVLALGAYLLLR